MDKYDVLVEKTSKNIYDTVVNDLKYRENFCKKCTMYIITN